MGVMGSGGSGRPLYDLDHPALAGRTGRGVVVAVIDSGVNPWHPHVQRIAGGVAIDADLAQHNDYVDRLGHGTAVTAAIYEKAPDASVFAVKVFDRSLSTSVQALIRAIDWSAQRGARLINLSLGTEKPEKAGALAAAVKAARGYGALVVSALRHDGKRWLPGSLSDVAGVHLDWDCPRQSFRIEPTAEDGPVWVASGFPRGIPGVAPSRNLKGISFAVANITGFLARLMEDLPEGASQEDALRRLEESR